MCLENTLKDLEKEKLEEKDKKKKEERIEELERNGGEKMTKIF